MPDLRWIQHRNQDWVDYIGEDGIPVGSISPLQQGGFRACTYRPSLGWPLRYDRYADVVTEEAARSWIEQKIEARTPADTGDALEVRERDTAA
ncbi:hypothetical protein MKK69_25035 [Methylobacterium sp. J-026]|uniref:hypothetical protein n=1 Tax=Methylobacterium sp. J-026 TaxID=2836624 RepID=UPI001FBB7D16|nr:hypothetical protein [Methylobacterium sp. J-026]MCJ2137270.1 hypothetical protein [Methylobacterium sp. J-026]